MQDLLHFLILKNIEYGAEMQGVLINFMIDKILNLFSAYMKV